MFFPIFQLFFVDFLLDGDVHSYLALNYNIKLVTELTIVKDKFLSLKLFQLNI